MVENIKRQQGPKKVFDFLAEIGIYGPKMKFQSNRIFIFIMCPKKAAILFLTLNCRSGQINAQNVIKEKD